MAKFSLLRLLKAKAHPEKCEAVFGQDVRAKRALSAGM
jgi:hypothetical protein